MSGPGDIEGDVSGEEAAWRDLVARFDAPSQTDIAAMPWPDRENIAEQRSVAAELPATPEEESRGRPRSAVDRTRIVRPAADPRAYSPPEEEDEPYVPEPLPPPAKMDALSKGAWVALICGPGYLLVGTLLGWTISGPEALAAIAAFIGGFVVLVLRMGDRPPRDDNDDGAVL